MNRTTPTKSNLLQCFALSTFGNILASPEVALPVPVRSLPLLPFPSRNLPHLLGALVQQLQPGFRKTYKYLTWTTVCLSLLWWWANSQYFLQKALRCHQVPPRKFISALLQIKFLLVLWISSFRRPCSCLCVSSWSSLPSFLLNLWGSSKTLQFSCSTSSCVVYWVAVAFWT